MGARLVGDDVGLEAEAPKLGQNVGGVGAEPDAQRPPLVLCRLSAAHRLLEVVGALVEVPGVEPALNPLRVHLDAQRGASVHCDRERLCASHPAEPGRYGHRPRQRALEAPTRDLREALVGPLQDPLAADVDPGAGGHLAVHRQPEVLQPAELVPVRPVRHQVGVGDEDARRPLVGAEHADRLARLDQHGLVVAQRLKRADDGVERVPGPRRPARSPVDHEVVRPLRDLRVEVVHQHPHRRLLLPATAGELISPGRVDGSRPAHRITHDTSLSRRLGGQARLSPQRSW